MGTAAVTKKGIIVVVGKATAWSEMTECGEVVSKNRNGVPCILFPEGDKALDEFIATWMKGTRSGHRFFLKPLDETKEGE